MQTYIKSKIRQNERDFFYCGYNLILLLKDTILCECNNFSRFQIGAIQRVFFRHCPSRFGSRIIAERNKAEEECKDSQHEYCTAKRSFKINKSNQSQINRNQ